MHGSINGVAIIEHCTHAVEVRVAQLLFSYNLVCVVSEKCAASSVASHLIIVPSWLAKEVPSILATAHLLGTPTSSVDVTLRRTRNTSSPSSLLSNVMGMLNSNSWGVPKEVGSTSLSMIVVSKSVSAWQKQKILWRDEIHF